MNLTDDQRRSLQLADERHKRLLNRFLDTVTPDGRCDYEAGQEAFAAELALVALMHKYGVGDLAELAPAALLSAPF